MAATAGGFRPSLNALDPAHDALWASRLRQAGATAVMTGRGGDSILVQAATGDVFTDLWRARGPTALFHPTLPRLAALNEVSVWDLLNQARSWRQHPAATAILAARFVSAPRPLASSSPWLQPDSAALGPAKALQIAGTRRRGATVALAVRRRGRGLGAPSVPARRRNLSGRAGLDPGG